jgi:hypothetical protein
MVGKVVAIGRRIPLGTTTLVLGRHAHAFMRG